MNEIARAENNPPINEYLSHIGNSIVMERHGRAWRITLPFYSLGFFHSRMSGEEAASPVATIYAAYRDGVWELSDLGRNMSILRDAGVDVEALRDAGAVQDVLADMPASVSGDGALTVRTSTQLDFGAALHEMVRANLALAMRFLPLISESPRPSAADVFSLQGTRYEFSGNGRRGGSSEETDAFHLSQGALAFCAEHSRAGDFRVELKPMDRGFLSGDNVLVSGDGCNQWTGAKSVTDEWVEILNSGKQRLKDGWRGILKSGMDSLKSGWPEILKPGEYRLTVEAEGAWSCRLLQPNLGQSPVALPYKCEGEGAIVAGPFRVGSRPLLVSGRHNGAGEFFVKLVSLDGSDECEVIKEDGQIHLEEHPTEAKPGKEYLLFVNAGGAWELTFTEGY